jgi:hypothetical protein
MKTSSGFSGVRKLSRVLAIISTALLLSSAPCIHAAETLVPLGATWRYRDLGIDQGTAWRQTNFNDAAWPFGLSQLGFGDGDEMTMINIGPMGMRYPTIYFRHTFVVTNFQALTNLAVRLMRDDGGIVYLNGVEVFRSNMPDEPPQYMTLATSTVSGSDESAFYSGPIPLTPLRSGTNVIAVEIHQADAFSSDISFNLELLANTPLGNLPPVATLSIVPSRTILGSDEMITFNITGSNANSSVSRIDVLQNGATIRTFFTNSATFTSSNLVPGIQDFTARAIDSVGSVGLSAPIRVFIAPPGFQAQSVFFPQFPSSTGLVLQVNAHTSSNVLHLMQPSGTGRGGAWMGSPQGVVDGFMTDFSFRIYNLLTGGADGFALVIAGTPQPVFGSGDINYSEITNSVAVEFDTWYNTNDGDDSDHHISVHTRGTSGNSEHESASIGRYTPPVDFSNGAVHRVRILYMPGSFRVFLDNLNTPVLNLNVNLGTLLSLSNGTAWVGFTAGSGGSAESHDILTWSHTSFANVPPTIALTSPAQAIRIPRGTNLTLSAAVSDPNGYVTAVEFYDGFDFLGEDTNAPFNFVWSNPPAGIHSIVASATDNGGLFAVSAPVVVEVLSSNANVTLFPNFPTAGNLTLQGSAALVANRLRLTPATNSQTGGAWLDSKQAVEQGFETVFQFQVSQISGQGADGFAFVIQNNAFPALGPAGDDMGYGSIANSLAIEFDTFQNPETLDLDANHIGIHSRGTDPNSAEESASLGVVTPSINLSDGAIHTVVIRYAGGKLKVFLDDLNNQPALELPMELGTLLTLDNGAAWVGFTSSTGGAFENHDILMWSFRPNAANPQIQLANPGVGPFVVPTNILLSAHASDPDGAIARVEFFVDGISIGEAEQFPFTKLWNNPPAGAYLLTATAIDEFGVAADSAMVALSVVERPLVAQPIVQADGSVMLAFPTTSGQTYTVQYTLDLVNWTNAVPSLNGNGTVVSWQDTGPPVTDSLPQNQPQRFYRVMVSPLLLVAQPLPSPPQQLPQKPSL